MNPDKLQNVQQKLEAFLAQEKEQKERAQRCFVSYLRSVYLMKNKEVFDAFKIKLHEYALSLGLAVAPRVRFLSKAQAQKVEKEEEESEEEEELRRFKAQLKGEVSREEQQNSESDESSEDEDGGDERGLDTSKTLTVSAGDADDDDDLRDLDLLTVKRKDVFNLTEDQPSPEDPEDDLKKKTEKETKYKEAKKILKRKFQVNTKVTFSEEGEAVQLWPPVQQAVTAEDEEEEEEDASGINVEKARERLKREDQEFDKQEYSRKVKAKHREKRLKERAARKEASKRDQDQSDEEDEVVAYLANDSEDEFDPSTLPDPDKVHSSSSSSEDEDEEMEMGSSKRQHSSEEEEEEEEKLTAGKRRKVSDEEEHTALDTGLSLAEDEELVLQLLGGRR